MEKAERREAVGKRCSTIKRHLFLSYLVVLSQLVELGKCKLGSKYVQK